MNIATALLQAIKERGLDSLFQVEEGAARSTKAQVIATMKGQTDEPGQDAHPTPEDQLRLVLIYYLSMPDQNVSKDELNELAALLKEAGANVGALEYVKKVREVTRMTMMASQPAVAPPAQGGEWTKGFSVLGSRVSSLGIPMSLANDRSLIDCERAVSLEQVSTISFPASKTSYRPRKSSLSPDSWKRSWSLPRHLPRHCKIQTTTSSSTPKPPEDEARRNQIAAGRNIMKAWCLS